MKNFKKILIVFLGLIPLLFTLSSCNFKNDKPLSAYDIAVNHGFVGSEEEWLESLKGEDGAPGKDGESLNVETLYQVALDNGFEGSLLDFVATYLKDTEINGYSAYEIAVQHGFKGTEDEWLASLKGATGNDGRPGDEVNLYDVYLKLVDLGEFSGTYESFLKDFLEVSVNNSFEKAISKAMLSCVKILCMNMTLDEAENNRNMLGQGGAGVIYKLDKARGDAYLITNYHVVFNERLNEVLPYIYTFTYGQEMKEKAIRAEFIGGSASYDIAILKVTNNEILKNSTVREIDYVDSNLITVGTTAIAIGNPKNNGISVTQGIVCVDSEIIEISPIKRDPNVVVNEKGASEMRVMRIDAAVNSGNSGGGLFNAKGELIGIVNAKIISSQVENMSYAIPCNIAIGVADNIIRNYDGVKPVDLYRPLLGIMVKTDDSKAVYDKETGLVSIEQKMIVSEVLEGSCCTSKLEANDELLSIKVKGIERRIVRNFSIPDMLLNADKGDTVTIKVLRNNQEVKVDVVIDNVTLIG